MLQARGKSGPLFHFDVHDDVRLSTDATVERDESHPGKVCARARLRAAGGRGRVGAGVGRGGGVSAHLSIFVRSAKVVERRWYDRNKHIFPASRWEVYDPTKDYGSYTIGDSSTTANY